MCNQTLILPAPSLYAPLMPHFWHILQEGQSSFVQDHALIHTNFLVQVVTALEILDQCIHYMINIEDLVVARLSLWHHFRIVSQKQKLCRKQESISTHN